MAPSRERKSPPARAPHGPSGAPPAPPAAPRDPIWGLVPVCMHCGAVALVALPSGWRYWVAAESEAARVLRRGPPLGPRPALSHGVCRACVRRHYPDLLPELRARYPAADY